MDARNDEVDRTTHSFTFQSFDCGRVVGLFSEHLPEQPESRNGIILENTDEIIHEVLGITCIAVNGKRSRANTCEGEHTAHYDIATEDQLVPTVVLHISQQLRQQLPHLKVQISTVNHLSFRGPDEQSSAGSECRVLIHEIEEEDLLKRQVTECCHCINLLHEILMDKLILGVPLHSIVEALRNRQQIHELQKAVESLVEGTDDGLPTCEWGFINLYLERQRDVSVDGSHVRHYCGVHHCEKKQSGQQALYRINHHSVIINSHPNPKKSGLPQCIT